MSLRSKVELECLATRLREEMHVTTKDPVRIHQILKEKHVLTWFKKLDDNFSGMAIRIKGNESSSDKYLLREDNANPLSSLTIGQGIISTGIFKSLTIFFKIINCCLSFSPKKAKSG